MDTTELLNLFHSLFEKRQKLTLAKIFDELANGEYKVNEDVFCEMLLSSPYCIDRITQEDLNTLFDVIQIDGYVTQDIFIDVIRGTLTPYRKSIVEYLFKKFDKDISGYIEFPEMTQFYSDSFIPELVGQSPTISCLNFFTKINTFTTLKSLDNKSNKPLSWLVVDDSKTILKTSSMMITKAGHKVDTALNGKIALSMMVPKDYDITLMDIHMPVMDGLESVTSFRKIENSLNRVDRQFIIGISATNDEITRINALTCGMDAFLMKPFQVDTILRIHAQFHTKISFNQLLDYYTDIGLDYDNDDTFASSILSEFYLKIEDVYDYFRKSSRPSSAMLTASSKSQFSVSSEPAGYKPSSSSKRKSGNPPSLLLTSLARNNQMNNSSVSIAQSTITNTNNTTTNTATEKQQQLLLQKNNSKKSIDMSSNDENRSNIGKSSAVDNNNNSNNNSNNISPRAPSVLSNSTPRRLSASSVASLMIPTATTTTTMSTVPSSSSIKTPDKDISIGSNSNGKGNSNTHTNKNKRNSDNGNMNTDSSATGVVLATANSSAKFPSSPPPQPDKISPRYPYNMETNNNNNTSSTASITPITTTTTTATTGGGMVKNNNTASRSDSIVTKESGRQVLLTNTQIANISTKSDMSSVSKKAEMRNPEVTNVKSSRLMREMDQNISRNNSSNNMDHIVKSSSTTQVHVHQQQQQHQQQRQHSNSIIHNPGVSTFTPRTLLDPELMSMSSKSSITAVYHPSSPINTTTTTTTVIPHNTVTAPPINNTTPSSSSSSTNNNRNQSPPPITTTNNNNMTTTTPQSSTAVIVLETQLDQYKVTQKILQKTIDDQSRTITSQQDIISSQQKMINNLLTQMQMMNTPQI